MSAFIDKLERISPKSIVERMRSATIPQVRDLLRMPRIPSSKAPILFSKAAVSLLEEMAQKARALAIARFGRTMTLYAPLYLSSHCVNHCTYCGFAAGRRIDRKRLSLEQAMSEAQSLLGQGIRHLLLVTGEAPNVFGLSRLCEVARMLRSKTASLSVEIFPSDLDGYRCLVTSGVDGLVLYQETYLKDIYHQQHPSGPKRNFERRLAAVEAGGMAGFRSLGIGVLLGLAPPMVDACYLALHAEYLTRTFPEARVAISFPRLRPVRGGTGVLHPVKDMDLVQLIVGMRLMFPDVELVLSTRESARLRDNLIRLGITRMSAGSRTAPGGYTDRFLDHDSGQFQVEDDRSIREVMDAIRRSGYDVVCKDFDPVLMKTEEAS